MKIAVWHNLPSGGGKRALHGFVQGLLERGHQVEAWCPPTAERDYLPLAEMIPERVIPLDVEFRPSRSRWGTMTEPWRSMDARLNAMGVHAGRCAAEIHAGGFDLFFAHPCGWFYMSHVGRHVRLPRVLYLQEPFRPLYEAMPSLPWEAPAYAERFWRSPRGVKRWLAEAIKTDALRVQVREEKRSAQGYDRILVNSFFSRESMLRAYGIDATVVPLGVDRRVFRPLGGRKAGFVVGLGSFDYIKGVDTAVEAVARLPAPRPALVWICNSGAAPYRAEVEALAARLGVHLDVKRRLRDEEVVRLLNEARVMLYTSRLEPFGLAPLEANACGTPVVAVAEGGVRETIRDGVNGFLGSRDPAALAELLRRFVEDPALAERMGRQAVEHVARHWSQDASIGQVERALQRVLAEKRASRERGGGEPSGKTA